MRSQSLQGPAAAILGLTVLSQVTIVAAQVVVNTPVTAGSTITLTAKEKDTAFVYDLAGKSKSATTCADVAKVSRPEITKLITVDGVQQLTVSPALKKGDRVCVAISTPGAAEPTYSTILTVEAAPTLSNGLLPTFATPVVAGSQISVTASDKATVHVYVNPITNGEIQSCQTMAKPALLQQSFTKTGSSAEQVSLSKDLLTGDQVCLESVGPSTLTKQYSASPQKVQDASAAQSASSTQAVTKPAFAEKLVGGSSKLSVNGQNASQQSSGGAGANGAGGAAGGGAAAPAAKPAGSSDSPLSPTLSVYQFDSGYIPADNSGNCNAADIPHGRLLPISGAGTNATATNSTTLSGSAPHSITLTQPLVAGTTLCLVQVGKSTDYSNFGQVTDPNDNGRARFDFTAGSVISNQQNGAKSSTAATYLDFGFYFTLMRAGGTTLIRPDGASTPKKNYSAWKPGIEDFIDLRMTSVPVSTSTTTTTVTQTSGTGSGSSSGTANSTTSPNVLSSQQAATIFGGFDFPFRLTRWDSNSNAFYLAPVVRSGFATLLNPSADGSSTSNTSSTTAAASSSTSSTTSSTTAQFGSVYWHEAQGLRIGWAKYPPNTDKAPVPIAQFDMLVGKYSNLPSIICAPSKATVVTTQPVNTTCYRTMTGTTGGATTYSVDMSRTLIPRLQLAGFIKFPNFPFLMGVDANLAQYAFGAHKNAVDVQNKAGDDVRIYFGFNLDPVTAIKKLGIPTP